MRRVRRWTGIPEFVEEPWIAQAVGADQTPLRTVVAATCQENLYSRFAAYYRELQRMPRRLRRALGRRTRTSLTGAALILAVGQEPARSATFLAGNAAELIAAVNQANDEANNPGPDIIELTADILLTKMDNPTLGATGLPVVTSTITIEGNEHRLERSQDADAFRFISVDNSADLTIKEVTLSGGLSNSGGALFILGTARISDSTISGNSSEGFGGGVRSFGTLSVDNSEIIDNLAQSGGGISNNGLLSIEKTTLSGNSASQYLPSGNRYIGYGGGVRNDFGIIQIASSEIKANFAAGHGGGIWDYSGDVTLADSTIAGNSAGDRGGGLSSSGNVIIADSTFSNNSAGFRGGAIRTVEGTVEIKNSTIAGNSSYGGGGINSTSRSLQVSNSTLASNAAHYGGAMVLCCNIEVVEITNSTVSGNTASELGGGLRVIANPTVSLVNTVVAGNGAGVSGGNCSGIVNSMGYNLSDDESCSPNGTTDKTPATFPGLTVGLAPFVGGGPGRGHVPLLSGSDAIDMGNPGVCPPEDQLGKARVGVCDIGAVEFIGGTIAEGALDVEGNGAPDALTDGILALRYLFGFSGDSLIAGSVVDPGCTRCTAEDIEEFLGDVLLDVDGNSNADALTDGILILRFLFGFRGEALVAGSVVAEDCTRCTSGEIEAFLEPGSTS